MPIILAMTMMTAEKRATGLFHVGAFIHLYLVNQRLVTSQPVPGQTDLTRPNLPGLCHPTPLWLHRFYLNRPSKNPLFLRTRLTGPSRLERRKSGCVRALGCRDGTKQDLQHPHTRMIKGILSLCLL
jgi:hypothetical protein